MRKKNDPRGLGTWGFVKELVKTVVKNPKPKPPKGKKGK